MNEVDKENSCSGLVYVEGTLRCKHGFPVFPLCRSEPMRSGTYAVVPCIDEEAAFRIFPETGKPNMLTSSPP